MRSRRSAFTLIELLIVVAILLLLTTFVVSIFKPDGHDKMRSAARVGQSAFMGARDRALHAFSTTKEASPANRRGIRLMRDATDPYLITSFAYIAPIDVQPPIRYGTIYNAAQTVSVEPNPSPSDARLVKGVNVDWVQLERAGVFPYPARIRIPADTGDWFTFSSIQPVAMTNPPETTLTLTTAATVGPTTCEFELGNEFLPNHQPIALPSNIVIDLRYSRLPALWTTYQSIPKVQAIPSGWISLGEDPSNTANIRIALAALDIMFSPRGAVTGAAAGTGPIYFLMNTLEDASQNLSPIDPLNKGEKLILALSPLTGHCQTYPIDPTDVLDNNTGNPVAGGDNKADDLFRFAKQASAAGN